jgi:EmrB/QacA subfamily drug resistance transporter
LDTQTVQRRRWAILGVLVISLMAIVIDTTVLNVALKTIADPVRGLGASQTALEWAINSYTLVFAGMLFMFGVLGDRIGRKRMLMIGLAVFGLGSLFSAYSDSASVLIAARAVMGLGGAAVMPQTLSIIANVFEGKQRARAIGIWASAVGIATAIGPVLGGVLLVYFWWGSAFLINVPLTALAALAVLVIVPESRNPVPGKIDSLGVLASIVGLVLLVYGIVQGGNSGSWGRGDVMGALAGGVGVLTLFVFHEARTSHPALNVRLFRDRRLSASVATIALLFFGLGGVYFYTSFYTQNVRGCTPLVAGLLTVPFALGQLATATRSATLVGWFGVRAVGGAGSVLSILAIAGYSLLGTSTPIWLLAVLFGLQGTGMGLATPAATAATMSTLPREQAGAGSALTNTARQVSSALGVAILGSILAGSYRSTMSPVLAALPAAARSKAGQSISATQAVAQHLGSAGRFLISPSNAAFVTAMHITTLSAVAIAIVGRLTVIRWLPPRPPSKHERTGAGRHRVGGRGQVSAAAPTATAPTRAR